MTTPNFKDFDQILADMMADLAAKGTRLTDINPGSVIRTLLEILAVKLDEGHYLAKQIINLFFISTTSGEYLDRRVAERGITRKSGSTATGTVTASRSMPAPFSQLIAKGTTFETEDHKVQVITTADAILNQGTTSVSLPVEALASGSISNLQEGTILKQVGIAVSLIELVTVSAPGLLNGVDAETDDDLRNRYLDEIRSLRASGNKNDYRKWAMEVPGVGGAYIIPLWAGPGSVKVCLLGIDKMPASQDVVDAVQAYISPAPEMGEGKAPIGAAVTCISAVMVAIDISVTIILDGSKTLAEVQTSYEEAIVNYLKEIAFSDNTTVRFSRIGMLLLETQGVTDCFNLLINGVTANIPVPPGVVAVKGMVTLIT